MAQQIATVWRDLDVENRFRGEKISDRRADFCIWRQNEQAGGVFAQAELDWAAKHSFRFDAAQFAFSNLSSIRQLCPWQCERNFVANFVIRRSANDLALRAAAVVYFANCEPISIRMARRRDDLRNNYFVDVRAARFDVFGFDAGASQQFGDLFRTFWEIDKFAQPVNGEFHSVWQSVIPSGVEESLTISESETFRDVSTSLDMTKEMLMRTDGESANRFARTGGRRESRTESSRGDPCRGRTRSRSTFRDRKLYRPALC